MNKILYPYLINISIKLINNLGGYSFGTTADGKPGYRKPDADAVTPFSQFKRYFNANITFSSASKFYEIGFRPKFFVMGTKNQNAEWWYDAATNKFYYTGHVSNGFDLGTFDTLSKALKIDSITDTGFYATSSTSYNGAAAFVIAFG